MKRLSIDLGMKHIQRIADRSVTIGYGWAFGYEKCRGETCQERYDHNGRPSLLTCGKLVLTVIHLLNVKKY